MLGRIVAVAAVGALLVLGLSACQPVEIGSFKTRCDFVRRAQHDPIGQPGIDPSMHLHDFFGSQFSETAITPDLLRAYATTCDIAGDTAGYWAPSLLLNGQPIDATHVSAYYFGHPSIDVAPTPDGLRVVAGDATATSPQPQEIVKWHCNRHPPGFRAPGDCGSETVNLTVKFPECWDGVNLDAPDHRSHMAYLGSASACPPSHPTMVPRLVLHMHYTTHGDPNLTFASGSIHSAHADFINAWAPDVMADLTARCLVVRTVCRP
jgi:hypothetical protein